MKAPLLQYRNPEQTSVDLSAELTGQHRLAKIFVSGRPNPNAHNIIGVSVQVDPHCKCDNDLMIGLTGWYDLQETRKTESIEKCVETTRLILHPSLTVELTDKWTLGPHGDTARGRCGWLLHENTTNLSVRCSGLYWDFRENKYPNWYDWESMLDPPEFSM